MATGETGAGDAQAEVLFYVPGLPAEYHAKLWGRAFPTAAAAVTPWRDRSTRRPRGVSGTSCSLGRAHRHGEL